MFRIISSMILLALLCCNVGIALGAATGSSVGSSVGSSSSSQCTPESRQCTLPSLGEEISLGDGYDIRAGTPIVGLSPWNEATIQKMVRRDHENAYKRVLVEQEKSSSERAEKLGVDISMEVNVLAGLESVGAGGKYLTEQKESSTSLRFLINYEAKDHFDDISLQTPVDKSNKNICSEKQLKSSDGPTHVITAVEYGTKAFVLFEREIENQEKKDEVATWMDAKIRYGAYGIHTDESVEDSVSKNYSTSSMKLNFLGNTIDVDSPTSFDQVNETVAALDRSVRENPQPLEFTITRIDQICKDADTIFSSIGNPILEDLATILRTMGEDELRIKTLLKNEIAQRPILRQALDKDYSKDSYGEKLDTFQANLKKNLKKTLVDVRSQTTNEKVLQKQINQVDKGLIANRESNKFLEYLENQLSFFDEYYNVTNVQVEDHEGSILDDCQALGNKDIFILTLNVLPKSNLATEYFEGTLNMNEDWVKDKTLIGSKFRQLSDKAYNSKPNAACFILDLAPSNPEDPVMFRAINRWGQEEQDNENLPEVIDMQVEFESGDCHWETGWNHGSVVSCKSDELATGACASGSNKDCSSQTALHKLRCCKPANNLPLRVNENDCKIEYSSWGDQADCGGRSVHHSCSSGYWNDCKKNGDSGSGYSFFHSGDTKHNVLQCCSSGLDNGMDIGTRGDQDCAGWKYGGWGSDLYCDDNMVLVGRCGSGGDLDCPHHSAHGIKCCKMFALYD